jgi:hypothetical protein
MLTSLCLLKTKTKTNFFLNELIYKNKQTVFLKFNKNKLNILKFSFLILLFFLNYSKYLKFSYYKNGSTHSSSFV